MRVGLVGWRGMVGSVLMQRMVEENDFDHIEPVFYSTSQLVFAQQHFRIVNSVQTQVCKMPMILTA